MSISAILLWFWQSRATPTPSQYPEPEGNSFYFLLVVVAVLSFFIGILVTAVFFLLTRPKVAKDLTQNELIHKPNQQTVPIKQCPQCNSTYTDEDLAYCLRDGLTLKTVGSMPIPHDPDKTLDLKSR